MALDLPLGGAYQQVPDVMYSPNTRRSIYQEVISIARGNK
jgi:hypothetical protein